jgi:hypothetical protein
MTTEFEPEELESPPADDPDRVAELERIEEGERLADVYLQTAERLLECAKLEPDWLVPGAIPSAAVSYFVGKPGAAKSWLAYDLACAVVAGRDWLGYGAPTIGTNPSALILNYDNPDAECGRRFLRLGLEKTSHLWVHSWGTFTGSDGMPSVLQFPDGFEILQKIVYARRPSLIVVDSLRQSHTKDESSSQEMAQIISQVKRFTLLGCAVVIVHHTRKNDGSMRGSTEIEASADSITDVEKEDAEVSLVSWRKTRGWQMMESDMVVKVVDEGDRTFVRGGVRLATVLEAGAKSRTDLTRALALSPASAKRLIDRAVEKGVVTEVKTESGGRLVQLSRRYP